MYDVRRIVEEERLAVVVLREDLLHINYTMQYRESNQALLVPEIRSCAAPVQSKLTHLYPRGEYLLLVACPVEGRRGAQAIPEVCQCGVEPVAPRPAAVRALLRA